MRTNVVIDDELMQEAMQLSGAKSKRELIDLALRRLIQLKKQEEIRNWRGKLKWVGDLDEMRRD